MPLNILEKYFNKYDKLEGIMGLNLRLNYVI